MRISITFKKLDPSDSLKAYVQKKLSRLEKMFDSAIEANVVLSIQKKWHIAEITLGSGKLTINAKEESENMYAAIDALVDKVKAQVKKNKEKLRRHLAGDKQSIKTSTLDDGPPV